MIPVYFPFTSLSPAAGLALSACFHRVVVYAPSPGLVHPSLSAAADVGIVDVRTPASEEESRVAEVVEAFQQWGDLQGGADLGRWKRSEMEAPLLEEASATSLRSAIRKRVRGRGEEGGPAPLFLSRVFLAVAQRFDGFQGETDAELAAAGELEKILARGLHGDAAAEAIRPSRTAPTDLGARMTATRLAAWSRLYGEDPAPGPLATDSRAVWEAVADAADEMEVLAELPKIPLRPEDPEFWRSQISHALAGEPLEPFPPAFQGPSAGFRAARVSGLGVEALLRKAAGGTPPAGASDESIRLGFIYGN
ncbi:MAG: hypothetical protein ACLFRG_11635 [Desulfococcaceae bacterium]